MSIVKLTVEYDTDAQAVTKIDLKQDEIKTWVFARAILEMAAEQADFQAKAGRLQSIQQQQMAAMDNQKLAHALKQKRLIT